MFCIVYNSFWCREECVAGIAKITLSQEIYIRLIMNMSLFLGTQEFTYFLKACVFSLKCKNSILKSRSQPNSSTHRSLYLVEQIPSGRIIFT